MAGYVHVKKFDDAAKPYKRVYFCEATNLYVKTHSLRRDVGFGRLKWDMTASLCDAASKVVRNAAGEPLVHVEGGGMSVHTDAGIRYADARDLLKDLLADDTLETAARIRQRARALFEAPLSQANVESRLVEDFERELLFMVAKVERAALNIRIGETLGGVKTA